MKVEPTPKRITDAKHAYDFMLAGNATLTLVSTKTQARFTYKVRAPEERKGNVSHFVSLLNGSDNEGSYIYLGLVRNGNGGYRYEHGKKARVGADAASAKAFAWFWGNVVGRRELPASVELWHAGTCGRCGRTLTVPESIERGIGPECWNKMGGGEFKCSPVNVGNDNADPDLNDSLADLIA